MVRVSLSGQGMGQGDSHCLLRTVWKEVLSLGGHRMGAGTAAPPRPQLQMGLGASLEEGRRGELAPRWLHTPGVSLQHHSQQCAGTCYLTCTSQTGADSCS